MITIVGISGSLRKHSFNAGLLHAAAKAVPDGCTLTIEPIKDIPLYNADVEDTEGIPPAVAELKDRIASADGLLMVTPENNNSMPGVFKNAIDWLSRPPEDRSRIFGNRPIGLMGATPGNFGTAFSQYAWLPVLRVLGAQVWSGRHMWVSGAMSKFDEKGNLTNEGVRKQLTKYMNGFVDFIKRMA
ncbi:NADPH-dependent FMN reductase [Thermodesulfobacteriota bacterium]